MDGMARDRAHTRSWSESEAQVMPGPNTYDSFIRQALGEQKLGAEQFGPVATDAYGTYADTGDEPPTQPVFSAEQGLVENAWNNYRRFRENYDQTPPAYANTQL